MPVFDSEERRSLAGDPELSIYVDLTTDHVVGLIDACANYLVRRSGSEPDELQFESLVRTPEIAAAHRTFVECFRRGDWDRTEQVTAGVDSMVFTDEMQAELRYHKYIRGSERITHQLLIDLLRAVRAYSAVAVPAPLGSGPTPFLAGYKPLNRYLHAHIWVVRFGREPFTDEEFVEDLHRTVLV